MIFIQATQQPLDREDLSTFRSHPGSRLVAPPGSETLEVVFHAAVGLPSAGEGRAPLAFFPM